MGFIGDGNVLPPLKGGKGGTLISVIFCDISFESSTDQENNDG